MDIFDFAMEKEKLSADYYRQLSEKTENSGLQNIFGMLAGEEARHYDVVSKMKENTAVEVAQTSVLSDAKAVFSKMRESAERFDFDISQTELYKKARDIESQSRDFYLEKAAEVTEEHLKGLFLQLAEEEKKHYFLLENIIEFVSRPEQWLENAEFYHLEEY
ncbi:MAG: ferritin family protein [Planctomycetota bacterium]|nr:MAG: ferritin family protein [Planctomycetota bacterium]